MKVKKKLAVTLMAVVLAMVLGLGGTLAWFTSQASAVGQDLHSGIVDIVDKGSDLKYATFKPEGFSEQAPFEGAFGNAGFEADKDAIGNDFDDYISRANMDEDFYDIIKELLLVSVVDREGITDSEIDFDEYSPDFYLDLMILLVDDYGYDWSDFELGGDVYKELRKDYISYRLIKEGKGALRPQKDINDDISGFFATLELDDTQPACPLKYADPSLITPGGLVFVEGEFSLENTNVPVYLRIKNDALNPDNMDPFVAGYFAYLIGADGASISDAFVQYGDYYYYKDDIQPGDSKFFDAVKNFKIIFGAYVSGEYNEDNDENGVSTGLMDKILAQDSEISVEIIQADNNAVRFASGWKQAVTANELGGVIEGKLSGWFN